MPAKYVLSQKTSGFHWNLVATNGRVIATSEVYNSKQAALAGIRSVQKNGSTDVIVTAEELEATRRPAKTTPATSMKKAVAKPAKSAKKAVAKSPSAAKGASKSAAKGTAKRAAKGASSTRSAKSK